ncbi:MULTISPECIES: VRR-NUC domain-containing protein [unclassified Photorhabdus]|uniref:VRR-NUC domain-containing protein n=1 Tax=unclassified Photorhabdus TaxID=2620880 RepID=UPI000DCBB62E|nr:MULTISPECIES: VRR-NUC domain-containing protein [unclassified Photorhabdus]RAW94600.1 VRR-NUC domain-containing protein [Photorhabdus sp. S9-53]RAW94710.1 VRR-NUC domain-containing protein [Photorhabdus sp. S10-54]RAW98678.1 VRR-NUC domain-containing protein [Photorhabdus sp. S8-52]
MTISNSGKMCPAVTSVNCTMEIGVFPADEDPCYLAEKAEYALRLPAMIVTKLGAIRFLNQVIMSGLIKVEELKHDFLWPYKAEVVFAIREEAVPLPMLATSQISKQRYGDNLPQSSNPFARPSADDTEKFGVVGIRRPDIILVKDETLRWPGRNATYFDGSVHPDNLKMLIEVKFPGDDLTQGQQTDYIQIATEDRFGVMRVDDNRSEEQKQYDEAWRKHYQPGSQHYKNPIPLAPLPPGSPPDDKALPAPPAEGVPGTIPQPLTENPPLLSTSRWSFLPSYEDWVVLGQEVAGLTENGLNYVRDSTRELLAQFGAWFNQAGKWVCEEIIDPVTHQVSYAFSWVNEQTGKIVTWTENEIKARWQTVQQGSDITLEELKNISWMQILKEVGEGMLEVVVIIAEVAVVVLVTVAVAAALIALVEILAVAAAASAAALAAVLAILASVTFVTVS